MRFGMLRIENQHKNEVVTHWVYDIYECRGLRIHKSPSYEIWNPLVQNKRIRETKSKRELQDMIEINVINKMPQLTILNQFKLIKRIKGGIRSTDS